MRVKCESCGTLHEVDASLAPLSGSWPTCPLCAPSIAPHPPASPARTADPLDELFDLGAPNLDPLGDDRDAPPQVAAPAPQMDDLAALFGAPPAAESIDAVAPALDRPPPSPAAPVQADDLFALFDAPAQTASAADRGPSPSVDAEPPTLRPGRGATRPAQAPPSAVDDLFADALSPAQPDPANTSPGASGAPAAFEDEFPGGGDPIADFGLSEPRQIDPAAFESAPGKDFPKFEPLDLAAEEAPGHDASGGEARATGKSGMGQIEQVSRPDLKGFQPADTNPGAFNPSAGAARRNDDALLSFEAARDDLSPMAIRAPKAGIVPRQPDPRATPPGGQLQPPAAMRRTPGIERSRLVLFGLVLLLVISALIWLWFFSDTAFRRNAGQAPPPAVAELLEDVRKTSPETLEMASRSSADEHVQRGLSLLQDDTAASYELARTSFVQALILDPARADAMALYVEATLHVRPQEPYLERAQALIQLALAEAPESSLPHRVHAFLLLQEGQEAQAISEAEQAVALALPEEKADALLMLGYAFLNKSAPVALEKIEQAVQRNPRLKRALYYQGLAAENAGELLQAVKAYEARLAIDAKERDSLQGLVRVYLKLGRHEDAREALRDYLKAYGSDGAPKLFEIALTLRFESKPKWVAAALGRVEKSFSRLTTPEKLLFHRLNAEHLIDVGNLAGARKSVDAAIRIDARDAAAHFQGLRIAILRRDPQAALQHLEACRRQLMPGLYHEYLGRIALMKGSPEEALRAFQQANDENPRRMASLLMEGVLLLGKGDERAAWSLHGKILDLDPSARAREPASFDDFHTPERALLDLARPLLGKPRGTANSTRWLYLIYGALLGFHSGEVTGPARAFDQVISADPTSLVSFVYRAQIELDRGDLKRAQWFIDTAIGFESRAVLPWYLKGRLSEAQGDPKAARDAYLKVLEFAPRHIDAEIRLAHLSMSQGDRIDATRRLRRVLLGSPHLERVRATLFELERDLPKDP